MEFSFYLRARAAFYLVLQPFFFSRGRCMFPVSTLWSPLLSRHYAVSPYGVLCNPSHGYYAVPPPFFPGSDTM
jgi:hypothetical protein